MIALKHLKIFRLRTLQKSKEDQSYLLDCNQVVVLIWKALYTFSSQSLVKAPFTLCCE